MSFGHGIKIAIMNSQLSLRKTRSTVRDEEKTHGSLPPNPELLAIVRLWEITSHCLRLQLGTLC